MKFFPDIESYFDTIREHRFSITISLFVLCAVISFFPHPLGFDWLTQTTTYAVGIVTLIIMFSISVGMILVQDLWPWIKNKYHSR